MASCTRKTRLIVIFHICFYVILKKFTAVFTLKIMMSMSLLCWCYMLAGWYFVSCCACTMQSKALTFTLHRSLGQDYDYCSSLLLLSVVVKFMQYCCWFFYFLFEMLIQIIERKLACNNINKSTHNIHVCMHVCMHSRKVVLVLTTKSPFQSPFSLS